MTSQTRIPKNIELHQRTKMLELIYSEDERYSLSCEYLRVYSPSAEVKGHGPGQEILQTGKINVTINGIQPMGNYALQLIFSDGHDSGIYSWEYMYKLATEEASLWQDYLDQINKAGASRDPDIQVVRIGN